MSAKQLQSTKFEQGYGIPSIKNVEQGQHRQQQPQQQQQQKQQQEEEDDDDDDDDEIEEQNNMSKRFKM